MSGQKHRDKWAPATLLLGLMLVVPLAGVAQSPEGRTPNNGLVISLYPTASAKGSCVLLSDVAATRGGTPVLMRRIAALDVADVPSSSKSITISKEEVAFRLQLAGIDRQAFRLEGADQVVVRCAGPPLTEKNFLTVAQEYLIHHLPWPADDVRIQLAQPLQLPPLRLTAGDQVRLEPELRSSANMLGRVYVDMAVLVNGRQQALVPVALDIKLTQELAVAARRIEAGEILGKDNLYPDRRVVGESSRYLTCAECMSGRRAKRAIPAGQLLAQGDVETLKEHNVLVKQHDLVKLMARVGPLRVVALGEALQDGTAGQSIRVRNVDSKSIILARVVDRALVEVDY